MSDMEEEMVIEASQPVKKRWSIPVLLSSAALVLSILTFTLMVRIAHADRSALNWDAAKLQLASRIQAGGSHPDQTMFGSNPSLIADVAEDVAPSVVNIDVDKNAMGGVDVSALPFDDDLLKRFFGHNENGTPFQVFPKQPQIIRGNGSGVIVNEQGYILTNNHVVSGADKIMVTLNDGRKIPATLVGKDRYSDLAVLKINAEHLTPAVLGSSSHLRPGEWVIAVGSPLGFDHTVTLGIVSAISRRVPDINSNVDFIQTDAAINPGNSGGPLVNLKGEVIGINTAISGSGQNIGFAIPVDTVKQVTDSLISNGKITRPWIGIAMSEMNPELAKSLGLAESTAGVAVAQVMPSSPSAVAGFRQGDIIQRIDGQKVTDPKSIQAMIREKPLNTLLHFQILREGQMMALSVKTDQLPDEDPQAIKRVIKPVPNK